MIISEIREQFKALQQGHVYLDNAATSLTPNAVLDKMYEYYTQYPGSVHRGNYEWVNTASDKYEGVRDKIQQWCNASNYTVVFTSGATNSSNIVVHNAKQLGVTMFHTCLNDHHANIVPHRLANTPVTVKQFTPDGLVSEEDILETSGESISRLAEYGSSYGVSTIVENHGGLTGNAKWLVKLVKEINSDFVGTLPDFGNNGFCMKRERLDLSNLTKPCDQQYDKYEGVKELLPFAKGISAKSHEFDDKGNDINTDFEKMINIIKESSYEGYIAIEYEGGMLNLFGGEGNYLAPHEGVIATKTLLEKLI